MIKRRVYHLALVTASLLLMILLVLNGCTAPEAISTPAPSSTPEETVTPAPGPDTTSTPSSDSTSYTVKIASKAGVGNYLVDGRGMTLYYTISDRPNYTNLPDEMLTSWFVFYVTGIVVLPDLKVSDFGTYMRDSNIRQTTYKGYPLYYFYQDKIAGDTFGNKQGSVWFVVNPDNFPPLP
jgi:predicted lipoprotein with Yx(FWY)xxD motif